MGLGLGFLAPMVPNVPTSVGGFAKDVASIFANRRKIDKERELERRRQEEMDALEAEGDAAYSEADQNLEARKLAEAGDTEENRSNLKLWGKGSAVYGGKVYQNAGHARDAWLKDREEELKADYLKGKGQDYASLKAEIEQSKQESERLRQGALAEIGMQGGTPEAEAAVNSYYDKRQSDAQAALDKVTAAYQKDAQTVAGAKFRGAAAKRNIAWRDGEISKARAALDKAKKDRSLAAGEGISSSAYEKSFHAGLSEAVAPLLEQYLYTNPIPDFDSYNSSDRELAASIERRVPRIIRLSQYAPDQAKLLLEQLKQNSAQGDKASRFEENRLLRRESQYSQALNSMRTGSASAAREADRLALDRAKLEQKKINDAAKIGLGYARIAASKWIADQSNMARRLISIGTDKARIISSLAATGWAVDEADQWYQSVVKGDNIKSAAIEAQVASGKAQSAVALYKGGKEPKPVPVIERESRTEGKGLLSKGHKVTTQTEVSAPDAFAAGSGREALKGRGGKGITRKTSGSKFKVEW